MAKSRAFSGVRATGATGLLCLAGAPVAYAQIGESMLVPPVIPEGYNTGRNVSVRERPRPDFDALGVRVGSFVILPEGETGVGATSNTYLSTTDEVASPFVYLRGAVVMRSDWSRHSLRLSGEGEARRFIGQSARNEDRLTVSAIGRLDASTHLTVQGAVAGDLDFENPFSGEALPVAAAVSRYRRVTASLTGRYTAGRVRGTWIVDRTTLNFQPLALRSGNFRDQSDRDRGVSRATVQFEYAQTPSLAFMGQISYSRTGFERPLASGAPNRDSNGLRILGGVNFDLAGRVRGTIGVGYTRRNYLAPLYPDAQGISVESRLEFFLTALTTVTVSSQRVLEDSQIGGAGSYWDSRSTLSIDHELLKNLILSASGQVVKQNYVVSSRRSESLRVAAGARYLSSRRIEVSGSVSYGERVLTANAPSTEIRELRMQVGAKLKL